MLRQVAALLLAALLAWAPAAAATDLLVILRDVSAEPGTLMLTACSSEEYKRGPCRHTIRAPAHAGAVEVTLTGLPEGHWALKAFHDTNGDFTLGTDWLGRPTEGVGFGNDAPIGRFGPPDFAAAAVDVPATGQARTALSLRYR